jgi:hypothetical protein
MTFLADSETADAWKRRLFSQSGGPVLQEIAGIVLGKAVFLPDSRLHLLTMDRYSFAGGPAIGLRTLNLE